MAFPAGRPIARFRHFFPAVTSTMSLVAVTIAIARAPAVASPPGATVPARAGVHPPRNGRPSNIGRSSKQPVDDQVAGKVAFFHFRGQDLADLEAPVSKALRAHGLTVLTELRPVDLPDQFRELAATLDLIAYVDGTVTPMRDERIRVALALRSGYSGRKVASLSVVATPEDLPTKLDELFWKRFGPALVRARTDAQKPRRRTRAPMQIDASSPMESGPARKVVPIATRSKGPS